MRLVCCCHPQLLPKLCPQYSHSLYDDGKGCFPADQARPGQHSTFAYVSAEKSRAKQNITATAAMLVFLTLAFSFLVIAFLVFIAVKGLQKSAAAAEEGEGGDNNRAAVRRHLPGRPAASGRPRGAAPALRHRRAPRNDSDDDEDDDGDNLPPFDDDADGLGEPMAYVDDSGKKLGVKKQRKLEMKEERKRAREIELQEREERKKKLEELEQARKLEEAQVEAEEKAKAEAERLEKEKRERAEHEEYLKLKESFAIEEEGCDGDLGEEDAQNKLAAFIDYIKAAKVVHMDELAGHFGMRTADVISRLQELLAQELLVGVIDDRGKFIYIKAEELSEVARFIRQRGRVSISELAENSNSFINLKPQAEAEAAVSQG